jgi:hypothetical protein
MTIALEQRRTSTSRSKGSGMVPSPSTWDHEHSLLEPNWNGTETNRPVRLILMEY